MEIYSDFDIHTCVTEMSKRGMAVIPEFLRANLREALLAELHGYTLIPQASEYGEYRVRQSFASLMEFTPASLFLKVREELTRTLNDKFATVNPYPLSEPLNFTDLVVQTYPVGEIGISPHRDGLSSINAVVVIILEGAARFCICDDREGNNPRAIRNEVGDLLLMPGPGFLGSNFRPFHFVDNITVQRTTFGLRHNIKKSPA